MAGAVELATAYIALVPSLKGASQSISSQLTPASAVAGAEGGASLGAALMGGLKKFALPIAGIVAGLSVGKMVKDSVKEFQDYQGAVNGFGRIAGGTIEQFSGLRGAIQLSGVDVDAASGGLTIFSKNLGNAAGDAGKSAEMVKKLGTDFKDASGNVKPMSEIMPGLADKFKSMPDGAEKTALAMQLFGRSGAQMLPFLNQGSEGIAKLTGNAGKMGLILDETDKKIFGAAKASLREYNTSIQGMHIALGSTALPIMTAFSNVGRSVMVPVIQAMTMAFSAARGPVLQLATHVQAFADRVRGSMDGLITLFTKGNFTGGLGKALGIEEDSKVVGVILGIRDAFSHLWAGLTMGPSVLASIGAPLEGLVAIGHAIRAPFDLARKSVSDFFAGITMNAGTVASIGVPLEGMVSVGAKVRQAFSDLWAGLTMPAGVAASIGAPLGGLVAIGSGLRQTFDTIVQAVGPLVPQLFALYTSFSPLHMIFSALAPVLPQIGSALAELGSAIGGALGSALTTVVPVMVQLASVIVDSLGSAVQAILPALVGLIPMVAGAFTQLLPVIAGLITQLAPLIASLLPPLLDLFSSLIPVVVELVTSVLPVAVQIITMLVQSIAPLVTILAAMLIPIIQALMPVVVTVFGIISDVITSAMQIVQGIIQIVLGIITGNWEMVWDGIVNTVSGALDLVGNVLGGLGDLVMGALGGIGSWLVDAGKALIQGFIDGITGMVGAIGDAVGGVLDFAKQFFPHSPAKRGPFSGSGYTSYSGQALAQDFAKGIASQNDVVADAAAGIMTSASLTGHVGISTALQNNPAGRGSGATFNTTINQVDDPIGTAHAVTRRQLALSS